jgi:outer membrane protein assembly factor BamD (BamD/ComL family)
MTVFLVSALWTGAHASGNDIFGLAERFYAGGDYYSAITEVLRYQCFYPAGALYSQSMLLMGKAYYKGNNYQKALNVFFSCFQHYSAKIEGEEALYLAGLIQLMKGSPSEAMKTHDIYRVTYRMGAFTEELDRDDCFASALSTDFHGALNQIIKYRERYPLGKYGSDLDRLEALLLEESGKPQRHLWVSVLGSVFIPGFGQFYTGNYAAGFLTFFTNALCIFMIYNGYRLHDTFQMVFFSLAEVAVYQFNIFGAVRAVEEFNKKRNQDFFKRVQLSITASF